MIAFDDVALLRPWWLIVLPVLALLFALTRPRNGALSAWQRAVDPPLLAAMIARGGASGQGGPWSPMILAVVLGALALSGPAIRGADTGRLRNLDATLVVMDLTPDVAGGPRLREATSVAHDVIEHSTARQAGLILYAGDAYLASALTDDVNAIDPLLFALDDQTVPDPGARPDRALALARKVLREAHIIQANVVLISAGGGLEGDGARNEAAALRAAGHRVDALFIKDPGDDHANATRRLAAMTGVANAGGGGVDDIASAAPLLAMLSGQTIQHLGASTIVALGWHDLGRFLLMVAGLPLLLGFRRVAS